MTPTQPRLFYSSLIALSVIGMLLIALSTPQGIGVSPDSVHYITTAKSLDAGVGWVDFSREVYDVWAPGYPLALWGLDTLGEVIGIALPEMIRLHNVMLYGLLVFFSGLTFWRYTRSEVLALLGSGIVLLSHVHLLVYAFAWSEVAFLLLIVLFFYFIAGLPSARHFRDLTPLLLVAALAAFQRYPGAPLVPLAALSILFLVRSRPLWTRFVYAFIFGLLASLPLTLWVLRTYLVTGTLLGSRINEPNPLLGQVGRAYAIIMDWFTTNPLRLGYFDLALLAFVALLAFLGAVFWTQRTLSPRAIGKALSMPLASLSVLLWIMTYLSVAILRGTRSPDVLENRVLSPIYIPLLCLLLVVLARLARWIAARTQRPRWGMGIAAGLLLVFALYPAYQGIESVTYRADGCCREPWHETDLIQWLQSNNLPGDVYSNSYAPMLHSDVLAYRIPRTLDDLRVAFNTAGGAVTLILYDDLEAHGCIWVRQCITPDYTLESLAEVYALETLYADDEAGIYRVSTR